MPDFPSESTRSMNTTLESHWFRSVTPRFPLFDRLSHLWQSGQSAFRWLCNSRPTGQISGVRPPGDVKDQAAGRLHQARPFQSLGNLANAKPIGLKSAETWEDLPVLSPKEALEALKYLTCNERSYYGLNPVKSLAEGYENSFGISDAFLVNDIELLPKEVSQSSLLNAHRPERKGQVFPDDFRVFKSSKNASNAPSSSTVSSSVSGKPKADAEDELEECKANNFLIDRNSGFAAVISYCQNDHEVVISFSPAQVHGMSGRQLFSGFLQWLGFVPKMLSQASQLTKLVNNHIQELNRSGKANPPLKLTLTGYCGGGSMASYAALRNKVPAVVMNPLRLANGARARIGQTAIDDARNYITELVVQGDWAADNRWAWLYLPFKLFGIDSLGPLGTARRFLIPNIVPQGVASISPHNNISHSIKKWTTSYSEKWETIQNRCWFLDRREKDDLWRQLISDQHFDFHSEIRKIARSRFGDSQLFEANPDLKEAFFQLLNMEIAGYDETKKYRLAYAIDKAIEKNPDLKANLFLDKIKDVYGLRELNPYYASVRDFIGKHLWFLAGEEIDHFCKKATSTSDLDLDVEAKKIIRSKLALHFKGEGDLESVAAELMTLFQEENDPASTKVKLAEVLKKVVELDSNLKEIQFLKQIRTRYNLAPAIP